MTEDKTVGWNHQLNRHEFEQIPGDGERQGSLACCSRGVAKSRTRLSGRTEKRILYYLSHKPRFLLYQMQTMQLIITV